MKGSTFSVAVPAYNEEAYIGHCLEHLISQINEIDEVIVVDNNSTDATRRVAEEFARKYPQIQILSEPNQGLTFARNCGLDAASGDIIARIDADTRVGDGWARAIKEFFSRDDTDRVGGVTGLNNSYDSPYRTLKRRMVDLQVAFGMLGREKRLANMHGANMALRSTAWKEIREHTSHDPCIHEDLDLALCMVKAGYQIAQLDRMRVDISPRRAYTPPWKFGKHVEATFTTIERHGLGNLRIRVAAYAHWVAHLVVWLAYGAYDPEKKRFSIRKTRSGGSERVLAIG